MTLSEKSIFANSKIVGKISIVLPSFSESVIGKSLAPFLKGERKDEDRKYTFSETGGLQGPHPSPKKPNVFCIKTRRYKLIYFKTPNKWELYDLETDPNEKKNLVGNGMDIEDELKNKLLEWINR